MIGYQNLVDNVDGMVVNAIEDGAPSQSFGYAVKYSHELPVSY